MRSKAPLLLIGPTGAGKSQLARRIYELKKARHQVSGRSSRSTAPRCAATAPCRRCSATSRAPSPGRLLDRAGLLRSANSGILFLDEIGELGSDEQAMTLRAVEEKRFLPVGADREVASDFQLIAGTNRDLSVGVARGRFREDLLARLNLWTFQPAGPARPPEDIEPNLEFELRRFSRARRGQNSPSTGRRATSIWHLPWRLRRCGERISADLGASIARMATLAPLRPHRRGVAEERDRAPERSWWRGGGADGRRRPAGRALWAGAPGADRHIRSGPACRRNWSVPHQQIPQCGWAKIVRGLAAAEDQRQRCRPPVRKYLARFGLDWQAVTGGA